MSEPTPGSARSRHPIPALPEWASRLRELGWVSELFVAGSAATGDYRAGVSDLDLVALVDGVMDGDRLRALTNLHREFEVAAGPGVNLGCAYVAAARLAESDAPHPTWTHGELIHRPLSRLTRAELVWFGYSMFGRPPQHVLPAMSQDDVRGAVRAELAGYWAWAARRPWMWLDPVIADLGLTAMARARHTLATGELLTKSAAIEQAAAPDWLIAQLRSRRGGQDVVSPRWQTARIAWRDARRTQGEWAGRWSPTG